MRMAAFIRANTKPIIAEWEHFAQTLVLPDGSTTPLGLRDHIRPLLVYIANDMDSPQSEAERHERLTV